MLPDPHIAPPRDDQPTPVERAPVVVSIDDEQAAAKMSLGEHLAELRRRVIYALIGLALATGVAMSFAQPLIRLCERPFLQAMEQSGQTPQLTMIGLTDAFMTYLRVGLYAGLVLAAPWIFYQLWMFVAAGLYRHERRYVLWAVPFSVLLFLLGAAFGVWLSAPAIRFFLGFADTLGVVPIVTLEAYISFMTNLLLVFGLVFEVPLVVVVLAKVGLVERRTLSKYRRHVIVAMTAAAAFLAPPDALSMILMVLPMWGLYELGIGLAWVVVFRKKAVGRGL
ncbi:MAG: twin-arginine translocase subunit TatC [Phycisphaerae bacterium]|nr:twin-arginine translocase subunit TatC [Phycisphaerae bacterium]